MAASEPAEAGAGFAAVAVDVATPGADRIFHYRVPEALRGGVRPGVRVRVPFGSRQSEGWVVGLVDRPGVAAVKDLAAVLDDAPPLDTQLLELAAWLAERYVCTYTQALRALVPADLRRGRVRERREVHLYPVPPPSPAGTTHPGAAAAAAEPVAERDALDDPLTRRPAQRAAWETLLRFPGLTRAELARRAGCSPAAVEGLLRAGLAEARSETARRDPFTAGGGAGADLPAEPVPEPDPDQTRALRAMAGPLDGPAHAVFLLHGVTGSGKTEVYLRAIERVRRAGRQAVVLVPEIALTPQTVARFRGRFGDRVAVLHSALGAGERCDEWWRIRRGLVDVVVGARSAAFAPVPHLGLVVVDEEHESSYKQDEAPRYHARAVAVERARLAGVPAVLGSATPCLESYREAAEGRWTLLEMPHRVASRPLPPVQVVDMRPERAAGNRSAFSGPLADAVAATLARGEQAILFLNRRGFATCGVCRECGAAMRCQSCAVALALHRDDGLLHCHYCGIRRRPPAVCPACGSTRISYLGTGTQRIEAEVRDRFPTARVLRMDLDTTATKGAHGEMYHRFRRGEADILIGTQMVAKGWDIAGVTLVGVLSADTMLHLPDFRSGERTFSLLCQVAGRAGRGATGGAVVVQTYNPEHYAVQAAAAHDYAAFVQAEMAQRRELAYPPFTHLVRVVVSAPAAADAAAAARGLAAALRGALPSGGVELLGPSEAPLARLRDMSRWQVALKGADGAVLREVVRDAVLAAGRRAGAGPGALRLAVDVDPQSVM